MLLQLRISVSAMISWQWQTICIFCRIASCRGKSVETDLFVCFNCSAVGGCSCASQCFGSVHIHQIAGSVCFGLSKTKRLKNLSTSVVQCHSGTMSAIHAFSCSDKMRILNWFSGFRILLSVFLCLFGTGISVSIGLFLLVQFSALHISSTDKRVLPAVLCFHTFVKKLETTRIFKSHTDSDEIKISVLKTRRKRRGKTEKQAISEHPAWLGLLTLNRKVSIQFSLFDVFLLSQCPMDVMYHSAVLSQPGSGSRYGRSLLSDQGFSVTES